MDFDNYFTSNDECSICFDEITKDNYVLYKDKEDTLWLKSNYCKSCIQYLISTQWERYVDSVDKANCAAELRRLLELGPPINLREKSFICNNERSEVYKLYYDSGEQSAKLNGSLTGVELDDWLKNQQETLLLIEKFESTNINNIK